MAGGVVFQARQSVALGGVWLHGLRSQLTASATAATKFGGGL